MSQEICNGIIIGAAGGASAGIIIWGFTRINECINECRHKRRIYKWLDKVTESDDAIKWRRTRAVASHNNLNEDRIRYICSKHKKIVVSSGKKELWGIVGRARDLDKTGEVKKSD